MYTTPLFRAFARMLEVYLATGHGGIFHYGEFHQPYKSMHTSDRPSFFLDEGFNEDKQWFEYFLADDSGFPMDAIHIVYCFIKGNIQVHGLYISEACGKIAEIVLEKYGGGECL